MTIEFALLQDHLRTCALCRDDRDLAPDLVGPFVDEPRAGFVSFYGVDVVPQKHFAVEVPLAFGTLSSGGFANPRCPYCRKKHLYCATRGVQIAVCADRGRPLERLVYLREEGSNGPWYRLDGTKDAET